MTLPGPAFARRSLLLAGLGAALSTAPPASARPPRALQFPRDHGSHPESRTEWWYFTGNVADAGGARFGYELTVFRQRLAPRLCAAISSRSSKLEKAATISTVTSGWLT